MVNKILPTSIISENPDIRYKPWLEYLEGDDLHSNVESMKNETKKFLCKNILYNKDIVNIDDNTKRMSSYGHSYNLVYPDWKCEEFDNHLFDKYFNIKSYFVKLHFSYDMLVNFKLFAVCKDSDYYIVPLIYKDFYADIDISHMLNDYSSFSTIVDYTRGIVYMNDVLMNYMKQRPKEQYDVLCNVLVNKKEYCKSKDCKCDEVVNSAYWTLNNYKIVDAIESDSDDDECFSLDYLPKVTKLAMFDKPEYFTIDNSIYITYANMPYRIYSQYVSTINGALYKNSEYGYFSLDKNRTAINVLAYDICKYGFLKPLLFKLCNGKLISLSKTRLVIAQYLKLPYIPALIYQTSEYLQESNIRNISLFDKNGKYTIDSNDVEFKLMLYPDTRQDIILNIKI